VHDDLHVLCVHVGDDCFRIPLEDLGVELERRLPGVPAAWYEAGAEIDDGVERDLLFPERLHDPQHLRIILERAVRLHVAERPQRRHCGGPGDRGEVLHRLLRIVGIEDEDVVETWNDGVRRRQSFCQALLLVAFGLRRQVGCRGFPRQVDAALGIAKVDLPPWGGDEHAPAARAEHHGARVAGPVHVRLPSRLHRVQLSAAIELHGLLPPRRPLLRPRTSFAHAEHRVLIEFERHRAVRFEHDSLDQLTGALRDRHRQRVRPHVDRQRADLLQHRALDLAQPQRRCRVRPHGDGGINGEIFLEGERFQRDADAVLPRDAHVELRRLARRRDALRVGGRGNCKKCDEEEDSYNQSHGVSITKHCGRAGTRTQWNGSVQARGVAAPARVTCRTARPTARRCSTFISSYSRDTTMPCAPAAKALTVPW
jgi:hypothetical protein